MSDAEAAAAAFNLASTLLGQGRFDEALTQARRAIDLSPDAEGHNLLGNVLAKLGDLRGAWDAYQASARLDDKLHKPHNNMGNLLLEAGAPDKSIPRFRDALARNDKAPRVWVNLGNALRAVGDLPAAVEAYEKALALQVTPQALHALGVTLQALDRKDEALEALRRAVQMDPRAFGSHLALADLLAARQEDDACADHLRCAMETAPTNPDAFVIVAQALERHGLVDEAFEAVRRGLDLDPANPVLLTLLADLMELRAPPPGTEDLLRRATTTSDASPTWLQLARFYMRTFQADRELETLLEARRRFPDDIGVILQLALHRRFKEELDEAESLLHEVLRRDPENQEAKTYLALVDLSHGNAMAALDKFFALRGADLQFLGMAALVLHYGEVDAPTVARFHRTLGAKSAEGVTRLPPPVRSREPDRRLRLAYLSPDFREHAVSRFLEHLVESHDRKAFEVYCYGLAPKPDEVTERFKKLDVTFREFYGSSAERIASTIARDQIDVLIDVAGWTTNCRPDVLAMRPAAVQATFLGYPDTTGLSTVHFRLTDDIADPPGMTEAWYVEELVRLGRCAWCFAPKDAAPPVAERPADAPIVFGSFNNLRKVTDRVLSTWAEILDRVPGSKLFLKSKPLMHEEVRDRMRRTFATAGGDPSRLSFDDWTVGAKAHLDAYGAVDIALDTFPYNGTTTTCEAITMGVPVVAFAGDTHVSRVSTSLLSAAGLGDWVAPSREAYVERAVNGAAQVQELRRGRAALRDQVLASELCDTAGYVRAIEKAVRELWATYCREGAAFYDRERIRDEEAALMAANGPA